MRRIFVCVMIAICALSLFGCGLWMDGDYVSVEPHSQQYVHMVTTDLEATSYEQIVEALIKLVAEGLDTGPVLYGNGGKGCSDIGSRQRVCCRKHSL